MMTAVLSSIGIRLMPTTCFRARKLVKSGKAVIHSYNPFTIRLTQRESGGTQPIEYCCDTGYQHIGISIKSAKHEYVGVQVDALKDEKKHHQDAMTYRRTRRNGKTRYRAARFDNRKATKSKGWLAPSIRHKKDIHLAQVQKYAKVFPITSIVFEMGEFDTQKLKAIEEGRHAPAGVEYQHGEQYGFDDVRNAVFTRDDYRCVCCGRGIEDGTILHAHHLKYRSLGGTNRMGNLITVCDRCHTPANHQKGGLLWNLMDKHKVKSFKDATFMTSVRWQMYNELKAMFPDAEIHLTYGSRTKEARRLLGVRKSHINDAYCMGDFHPTHRSEHWLYTKKRRNNRVLAKFYDAKYIDSRDGKKKSGKDLFSGRTKRSRKLNVENLHRYRQQKVSKGRVSIRRQHYPIQPGDTVIYEGKKYITKGVQNLGTYLKIGEKVVPVRKICIHHYAGGYIRQMI